MKVLSYKRVIYEECAVTQCIGIRTKDINFSFSLSDCLLLFVCLWLSLTLSIFICLYISQSIHPSVYVNINRNNIHMIRKLALTCSFLMFVMFSMFVVSSIVTILIFVIDMNIIVDNSSDSNIFLLYYEDLSYN